jgi:hypothetical protein
MLRHVALVRGYVSEESIAPVIMVERIGELGTMLAVTTTRIIEAIRSSETPVLTRTTRRNIPEYSILQYKKSLPPPPYGTARLITVFTSLF